MLLPRVITAIVGIPLVLLAIWYGGIPYLILIGGVIFFSLREFYFLARIKGYPASRYLSPVLGVFLSLVIFLSNSAYLASRTSWLSPLSVIFILWIFLLIEIVRQKPENSIERLSLAFWPIIFIGWSFSHLLLLRDIRPFGREYTLFLFVLIWLLDTAAYAVGLTLGKRRLAPEISPKKSVEGFLGALVVAGVAAVILRYFWLSTVFSVRESLILGVIIATTSQISDLAESLLKRDAAVKDSGNIFPGHGGVFDRFDSFLLTAPVFYYYILFIH